MIHLGEPWPSYRLVRLRMPLSAQHILASSLRRTRNTRSVIVLLVVFHSRWGLGSRRKATIDLSLPFHLYQPAVSNPHLTILVAMAFACLWSVLSPGILGCEPQEARAQDCRRCPTLAPSAVSRLQQEIKRAIAALPCSSRSSYRYHHRYPSLVVAMCFPADLEKVLPIHDER